MSIATTIRAWFAPHSALEGALIAQSAAVLELQAEVSELRAEMTRPTTEF